MNKKRKMKILTDNEKNLNDDDCDRRKKIKLFNSVSNNNILYYLKLSNDHTNACYCNSVIQALLSLGPNYFDEV